jgi:nicotinamidase-related amidase
MLSPHELDRMSAALENTPMSPVFVFVDLLEDFFAKPPMSHRRPRICNAVNDLVGLARQHEYPIVWVRQEFEPDLNDAYVSMRETGTRITIRGTGGSDLLEELKRVSSDHEIVKKRYSAFFGTNLARLLQELGCDRIVLGGANTHACVRATAVDAFQMDYHVILAADAISSYDEQYHRESMRYLAQSIGKAMSNDEIKDHLDAASGGSNA